MEINDKLRREEMQQFRDLFNMTREEHHRTRLLMEMKMMSAWKEKEKAAKKAHEKTHNALMSAWKEKEKAAKEAHEKTRDAMKEGFKQVKESQNKISNKIGDGFTEVEKGLNDQNKRIDTFRDEVGVVAGQLTEDVHNLRDAAARCFSIQQKEIARVVEFLQEMEPVLKRKFDALNDRTRRLRDDGSYAGMFSGWPRGRLGGTLAGNIPSAPMIKGDVSLKTLDELSKHTNDKNNKKKEEIKTKFKKEEKKGEKGLLGKFISWFRRKKPVEEGGQADEVEEGSEVHEEEEKEEEEEEEVINISLLFP